MYSLHGKTCVKQQNTAVFLFSFNAVILLWVCSDRKKFNKPIVYLIQNYDVCQDEQPFAPCDSPNCLNYMSCSTEAWPTAFRSGTFQSAFQLQHITAFGGSGSQVFLLLCPWVHLSLLIAFL
jgi:hypothetical protein